VSSEGDVTNGEGGTEKGRGDRRIAKNKKRMGK